MLNYNLFLYSQENAFFFFLPEPTANMRSRPGILKTQRTTLLHWVAKKVTISIPLTNSALGRQATDIRDNVRLRFI